MDKLDAPSVVKAFRTWDADGSGKIDRGELAQILRKVCISHYDIDGILDVADIDGDGKIDYEEFVRWISDPKAPVPELTDDGWVAQFDFPSALAPLFKCMDRNADHALSAAEFAESYQILASCLKMHPDCTNLEGWTRDPDDLLKLIDGNNDSMICFDEFLEWQVELIRNSRIPTFQLPRLFEELAHSLDVIFDIDERIQQNKPIPPGTFAALESNVKRTCFTAERLYGSYSASPPGASQLAPCSRYWAVPPSATDIRSLVQLCAKKHGIMLPMCQTKDEITDKTQWLNRFNVGVHRQFSMAVGRIMFCFPACRVTGPQQWYAQVLKARCGGSEQSFFYRFTNAQGWQVLKDEEKEQFHAALADLPAGFRLLALLQGHAYMANTMRWEVVLEALDRAVQLSILDTIAPKLYEAYIHKLVEQHIQDQIQKGKKTYPSSNIDGSIMCFLTCLELEPFHVLAGLFNCRAFEISDELWSDMLHVRSGSADPEMLQRRAMNLPE